ncbi:DUF1427 family protein [Streptomyces sp. NBC_00490]|uniref:DUF1427 family protein n=1 Tax=Streptomyces sp. NBC_00490 TaxID=2903657 RepID=UPI002E193853
MRATRRPGPAAFGRRLAISFAAGLAMGALYWACDLKAPAPALLGLTGLLGIGLGERAAMALSARLARHRTPPAPPHDPQLAEPEKASRCTCLPPTPD